MSCPRAIKWQSKHLKQGLMTPNTTILPPQAWNRAFILQIEKRAKNLPKV